MDLKTLALFSIFILHQFAQKPLRVSSQQMLHFRFMCCKKDYQNHEYHLIRIHSLVSYQLFAHDSTWTNKTVYNASFCIRNGYLNICTKWIKKNMFINKYTKNHFFVPLPKTISIRSNAMNQEKSAHFKYDN